MPNHLDALTDYQLSCSNADSLKLNHIKYTIPELERMVTHSGVSLKSIVRTQDLTEDFCKNYVLSGDYIVLDSDTNIDMNYVLKYQTFETFKNKITKHL